VQNYWKRTA